MIDEPSASAMRIDQGLLAGVALVDIGQFDRLSGHLWDRRGQHADLRPVLLIGRWEGRANRCPSVSTAPWTSDPCDELQLGVGDSAGGGIVGDQTRNDVPNWTQLITPSKLGGKHAPEC
jgi:hypothetical protein